MSFKTGKSREELGDLLCGALSAQEKYVYAAAEDGVLYCFNSESGAIEYSSDIAAGETEPRSRAALGLEHHPGRNLLVSFSEAGTLKIWLARSHN